jgi:hypothetical protein
VFGVLEIIIGVGLVYFGLDRLSVSDQVRGLIFGLIATAGLVLAVHGVLVFNVPRFFANQM